MRANQLNKYEITLQMDDPKEKVTVRNFADFLARDKKRRDSFESKSEHKDWEDYYRIQWNETKGTWETKLVAPSVQKKTSLLNPEAERRIVYKNREDWRWELGRALQVNFERRDIVWEAANPNRIAAVRKSKGVPMAHKLALELLDASADQGSAVKKKQDVLKMAQANKAFAHLAKSA